MGKAGWVGGWVGGVTERWGQPAISLYVELGSTRYISSCRTGVNPLYLFMSNWRQPAISLLGDSSRDVFVFPTRDQEETINKSI